MMQGEACLGRDARSLPKLLCRGTRNSFFHTHFRNFTESAFWHISPGNYTCANSRNLLALRCDLPVGRLALRLPITQRGCGLLVPPPVQVQPPFLRAQARLCGPDKKTTRLLRCPDRHQIQGANHGKIAWYRSIQTIRGPSSPALHPIGRAGMASARAVDCNTARNGHRPRRGRGAECKSGGNQ